MIQWKQEYATGNRLIDAEHKVLFEIANEVVNKESISIAQFKDLYLELLQYTQMHFCSEEILLREIGYIQLSTHQKNHLEIIQEMHILLRDNHTIASLQRELAACLQHWLINHILREDMAWRPVFQAWRAARIGR